jgi:hypothetical protein
MAHLIRSAKPGSDWTQNELRAFNIEIETVDVARFFRKPDLPRPSVRQGILSNEHYPIDGLPDKDDQIFFDLMDQAMSNVPGQESAVVKFTAHLLKLLGYDDIDDFDRSFRQRVNMPLSMCGSRVPTTADLCVVDRSFVDIALLVQVVKMHPDQLDPAPKLIAQAIATFQRTNMRLSNMGLPTLFQMDIQAITIFGTAPTFFEIYMTHDFLEAVERGSYPSQAATVRRLVPPVPQPALLEECGMRLLDNRAVILGCFEAFKKSIYPWSLDV